jgi:serine protease
MTRAAGPSFRARSLLPLLRAAVAALATALAFGTVQAAAPRGLIVELTQAPAHDDAIAPSASSAEGDVSPAQRERMLRVLAQTGLDRAAAARGMPGMRRTGRAAHVLEFRRGLAPDELDDYLARLRASPEVAWAEPNERESLQQNTTPSDPLFPGTSGQWWLQPVGGGDQNVIAQRLRGVPGVQRAWSLTNGSPQVRVAVLDTGTTAHPELEGVWLPGIDMVSDPAMANDGGGRDTDPRDPGDWISAADQGSDALSDCATRDSSWHGTIVSGILAARSDNNQGVAAVDWNARIVPVRVAGKCGAEVADIIDGMRWAAGMLSTGPRGFLPRNANPVRVINVSFAGDRPCNRAYQSTIDELLARGVVVVAAAGNGQGPVMRPANCRGVIAVTALNRDGFKAHYASFGPEATVATVGGDDAAGPWGAVLADGGLLSVFNAGTTAPTDAIYARSAGTSFATPIVSGTVALMLAINPALSVQQVRTGLARSARAHVQSPWLDACSAEHSARCLCTTATCGPGMLDSVQALLYARDPSAYVAPARSAEVLDNPELASIAQGGSEPSPPSGRAPQEGSGGGALGLGWLLALGLTVLLLRAAPRTA